MKKIEKKDLNDAALYLLPQSPAFTAGTPKGEIVSIHTGQCGLNMSEAVWQLYQIEHGIDSFGRMNTNPSIFDDDDGYNTIFHEQRDKIYKPRALLMFNDIGDYSVKQMPGNIRGKHHYAFRGHLQ